MYKKLTHAKWTFCAARRAALTSWRPSAGRPSVRHQNTQ